MKEGGNKGGKLKLGDRGGCRGCFHKVVFVEDEIDVGIFDVGRRGVRETVWEVSGKGLGTLRGAEFVGSAGAHALGVTLCEGMSARAEVVVDGI